MNTSVPVMGQPEPNGRMQRLNTFLDQYVLPYPVKYLTNRLTILATLCLLIPLIVFANVQVFVLATNSYLNVMSVVVSSTVLLYSTISEVRDRTAAQRREELAKAHQDAVERRAQAEYELILKIRDDLNEHVSRSLDEIQQILINKLEKMQTEDHDHIEEIYKTLAHSNEVQDKELAALNKMLNERRP